MSDLQIKNHVPLDSYSTFGISGKARKFAHLTSTTQIPELVARAKQIGLPILPLGGGSNTVFSDSVVSALCVDVDLIGIDITQTNDGVIVRAAAGENWDQIVAKTV
ncbi:MAG: UDP-N-acetylmuramate dehydrogenase, partial [Parcubacteria group bacterium SW_6_46_9]